MNSATRLRADWRALWALGLCDEACALIPPAWRQRVLDDWAVWARLEQLPPGAIGPLRGFVPLEGAPEAEKPGEATLTGERNAAPAPALSEDEASETAETPENAQDTTPPKFDDNPRISDENTMKAGQPEEDRSC